SFSLRARWRKSSAITEWRQSIWELRMTDILRITDLRAGYGSELVLRGVSLSVGMGQIVAVIACKVVDKSDLVGSFVSHLHDSAGRIDFCGRDMAGLPPQARARLGMGYIPQGREVFPRLSVRENLLVGEQARRGGTPDYERVYRFFPILKERARQAAGTFS